MLLSFIIPVYNRRGKLRACIDNVLRVEGVRLEDVEVIVVDDASTDGTEDLGAEYSGVRCFRLENNSGPGTARNVGLFHAQGEYVFFLDSDDRIDPDALLALIAALKQEKDVDVFYTGAVRKYGDGREESTNVFERTGRIEIEEFLAAYKEEDWAAWQYCYRKEYLLRHGILFPPWWAGEDAVFIMQGLFYARFVYVFAGALYQYMVDTDDSLTTQAMNIEGLERFSKPLPELWLLYLTARDKGVGEGKEAFFKKRCLLWQNSILASVFDMRYRETLKNHFERLVDAGVDEGKAVDTAFLMRYGIHLYAAQYVRNWVHRIKKTLDEKRKRLILCPAGKFSLQMQDIFEYLGVHTDGFADNYAQGGGDGACMRVEEVERTCGFIVLCAKNQDVRRAIEGQLVEKGYAFGADYLVAQDMRGVD